MRKKNSVFRTKFITESGCYIKNQDCFDFVELEKFSCYCIADGNERDLESESARLAVTAVIEAFRENPGCSKKLAKYYMQAAQKILYNEGEKAVLETSMIILLTDYQKALWISRGNTRLFGIRNGMIKWKAKESNLAQDVGFAPVLDKKRKLKDGDIFVLYTGGAWKNIGNEQLLEGTEGMDAPEKICSRLEEIVLGNRQNMIENYTIVSIFIDKTYKNYTQNAIWKISKNGGAVRT